MKELFINGLQHCCKQLVNMVSSLNVKIMIKYKLNEHNLSNDAAVGVSLHRPAINI